MGGEIILKVTKKSGNRGSSRKLSLWNRINKQSTIATIYFTFRMVFIDSQFLIIGWFPRLFTVSTDSYDLVLGLRFLHHLFRITFHKIFLSNSLIRILIWDCWRVIAFVFFLILNSRFFVIGNPLFFRFWKVYHQMGKHMNDSVIALGFLLENISILLEISHILGNDRRGQF